MKVRLAGDEADQAHLGRDGHRDALGCEHHGLRCAQGIGAGSGPLLFMVWEEPVSLRPWWRISDTADLKRRAG